MTFAVDEGGGMPTLIGPSDTMFRGRCPLPLEAVFVITVETVGATRTMVHVTEKVARVKTGSKFAIGHACRANEYDYIESTTIDEYRILLHIGECLGEQGMPQLRGASDAGFCD